MTLDLFADPPIAPGGLSPAGMTPPPGSGAHAIPGTYTRRQPDDTQKRCEICGRAQSSFGFGLKNQARFWACAADCAAVEAIWMETQA